MNLKYHVFRPVNHDWRLPNEFPNQGREDEGWMALKDYEKMSIDSHGAPSPPPPIPLAPPLLFCRAGSGLPSRKILQQLDCGSCARAAPTYHWRGLDNIWWHTHSQRIHQSLASMLASIWCATKYKYHKYYLQVLPCCGKKYQQRRLVNNRACIARSTIFNIPFLRIKYWSKFFGSKCWARNWPPIFEGS